MQSRSARLRDFEFDGAAFARTAAENRLPAMEIEFSLRCNFTVKGPCGSCDLSDGCYGCRGAAFQVTGEYPASDPLCRRNCSDES
jgi:MoaA/NifB/PqqE/SkfB family radical SAM enzyme